MMIESGTGVIARQEWLKSIEETARRGIQKTFRSGGPTGQNIRNALHGSWLGHPLHAALTRVPIDAWTAAMVSVVIDAFTDRKEFGIAAEGASVVGMGGAFGDALAGLTDWQDIDPRVRHMGLTQGLLNVGAVPIGKGEFLDEGVKYPWHGSRFALEERRVLDGPVGAPAALLEGSGSEWTD